MLEDYNNRRTYNVLRKREALQALTSSVDLLSFLKKWFFYSRIVTICAIGNYLSKEATGKA